MGATGRVIGPGSTPLRALGLGVICVGEPCAACALARDGGPIGAGSVDGVGGAMGVMGVGGAIGAGGCIGRPKLGS